MNSTTSSGSSSPHGRMAAEGQNSPPSHLRDLLSPALDLPERIRTVLAGRYDLADHEVNVDGRKFTILGVRDTNVLVDAIEAETFALDERFPYWAELWTSSVELARHCLRDVALAGKTVLDLGTGLGLSGIAAACGGAHVVLSDYEPDALLFAHYNAWRHAPESVRAQYLRTVHLDWRSPPDIGSFELVLGADIIYERRTFPDILRLLHTFLVPGGTALFADPDRRIGWDFFSLAADNGFAVDCRSVSAVRQSLASTVTIAALRRRGLP